jgi:hypothetical protein
MTAKKYLLITFMVLALQPAFTQPIADKWARWNLLLGEWVGEGNGQPGQGSGSFSFSFDLDGKVLVRKSHTDFPESKEKDASVHNDLMFIYPDFNNSVSKAIYFDNEGHVINYSISYSVNSIVLTSETIPNVPIFRLSYSIIDNDTVNVKFEVAPFNKPEAFRTYIEGKSIRKSK